MHTNMSIASSHISNPELHAFLVLALVAGANFKALQGLATLQGFATLKIFFTRPPQICWSNFISVFSQATTPKSPGAKWPQSLNNGLEPAQRVGLIIINLAAY